MMVDRNVKAERSIAVARLLCEGKDVNADPEPGGWRRVAATAHNLKKVDLEVVPIGLGEGKLTSRFKVAHLTASKAFRLSDGAKKELKEWVDGGGTLIADACGGIGGGCGFDGSRVGGDFYGRTWAFECGAHRACDLSGWGGCVIAGGICAGGEGAVQRRTPDAANSLRGSEGKSGGLFLA